MNAVGASPVHIDSKRWKALRLPSSCLPSRGRRNVGGLKPHSVRKGRGRWLVGLKRARRYGQPPAMHGIRTGTPAPYSKPNRRQRGARREKEEGTEERHLARRFASAAALRRNPRLENATPGASPSAFGSALRPVCSFSAHSQEMGVRSSNRSGTHGSPPRISGRKLAARGNSRWQKPSRARRWPAQWTRACVVCSCRSCLAVRGSRCRPALSVGRRRDLAFGPLAPPSHRKGRRAKGSRMISRAKTCGVTDRKRTRKGTQSEIVTAGRGWWFLLAPAARNGAEELRVEKRHQMMEDVPVCSKPISFTGRRWMQTRLTRPDSHELR